MGYREVTVLEVKGALLQWLDGAGKKVIARRQSIDVKTVRRYVRVTEECRAAASRREGGVDR